MRSPTLGPLALAVLLSCAASCGGGSAAPPAPDAGPPVDPPPVSTSPGAGPASFVDPFIGTGDASAPDPVTNGSAGSTFPGAALPFGMVQFGPDTPMARPAGYHFGDGVVTGFSLTHLSGAGCNAKRDFPILPVLGSWDASSEPRDTFTHAAEIASPGFYEVTLGSGIVVDLTATARTGLARFTFPEGQADAKVLISGGWLGDALQVNGFAARIGADGTITGHRNDTFFCGTSPGYTVYFAARFDRAPSAQGTWSEGSVNPGATSVSGSPSGIWAGFDTSERRVVHLRVGLSYVSEAGALQNLEAESGAESAAWDFDAVHAAAIERWNGYLGRVEIEGGTADQKTAFYTALYHAFVQPGVAGDVSGAFVGFDGKVRQASGYTRYADFSGWDVYRSWVQLASVLAPAETSDMMQSLVAASAECGALPKWALESTETGVMVGDPADAILANAYAFGARGFDAHAALAAMVKGATDPSTSCGVYPERKGLADYLALHYCPVDGHDAPDGPPATTLEYALDDFAIAQLAGALGDTATAQTFLARGAYWKNVFDPSLVANGFTGYMLPRLAQDQNGMPAFQTVDVGQLGGFVEGTATQYTFVVPHDVPGLIAALGGDAAAIARLDSLFTQLNAGVSAPYCYIGNEPSFGPPWEYPFAGAPWRTQDVVRRILTQAFGTTPGGLPGNDDLGAMSAWQAWAMLGLYPAIPGVGGFVLGSPTFPKATIALAGGKTLVITGDGAAADAPYVQSLTVNGAPSTSTWVTWGSLSGGGTLAFVLGKTPNTSFGSGAGDRPPAFYP